LGEAQNYSVTYCTIFRLFLHFHIFIDGKIFRVIKICNFCSFLYSNIWLAWWNFILRMYGRLYIFCCMLFFHLTYLASYCYLSICDNSFKIRPINCAIWLEILGWGNFGLIRDNLCEWSLIVFISLFKDRGVFMQISSIHISRLFRDWWDVTNVEIRSYWFVFMVLSNLVTWCSIKCFLH